MEKWQELNLKILYLTNHQSLSEQFNDYLSNLLLHGLREHFDRDVIDFPGSWYLYDDESKRKGLDNNDLWGKGFTIIDLSLIHISEPTRH